MCDVGMRLSNMMPEGDIADTSTFAAYRAHSNLGSLLLPVHRHFPMQFFIQPYKTFHESVVWLSARMHSLQ